MTQGCLRVKALVKSVTVAKSYIQREMYSLSQILSLCHLAAEDDGKAKRTMS